MPPWIRRAVVRGLSSDPEARWPDLCALLAALDHHPAARRRRIWAGVTAMAVVAVRAMSSAVNPAIVRTMSASSLWLGLSR